MADMRTIGIALDAYRADHNDYIQAYNQHVPQGHYPLSMGWLFVEWAEPGTGDNRPVGFYLTTPVQYLTSIPLDPFTSSYSLELSLNNPGWNNGVMRNASCFYGMRYNAALGLLWEGRKFSDIGYVLNSVGPDLKLDARDYGDVWGTGERYAHIDIGYRYTDATYDPTNGTVSDGEIVFVGKGVGFVNSR